MHDSRTTWMGGVCVDLMYISTCVQYVWLVFVLCVVLCWCAAVAPDVGDIDEDLPLQISVSVYLLIDVCVRACVRACMHACSQVLMYV